MILRDLTNFLYITLSVSFSCHIILPYLILACTTLFSILLLSYPRMSIVRIYLVFTVGWDLILTKGMFVLFYATISNLTSACFLCSYYLYIHCLILSNPSFFSLPLEYRFLSYLALFLTILDLVLPSFFLGVYASICYVSSGLVAPFGAFAAGTLLIWRWVPPIL